MEAQHTANEAPSWENQRTRLGNTSCSPDEETLGPFPINSVQTMDCIHGMRQLPDNSVDIVIADPPYNASKGGVWQWDNSIEMPGFGGDWSKIRADWDNMPLAEYSAMTLAWLREAQRVTRPSGSIWVHGTYHNAGIINFMMQLLGIENHQTKSCGTRETASQTFPAGDLPPATKR